MISKVPLKGKSIFPQRSVQHEDQVIQVPKSMILKIVSWHVKNLLVQLIQLLGQKQEMRYRISEGKNQFMLIQFTGTPLKPTEMPTHLISRKTSDSDID